MADSILTASSTTPDPPQSPSEIGNTYTSTSWTAPAGRRRLAAQHHPILRGAACGCQGVSAGEPRNRLRRAGRLAPGHCARLTLG